MADILRNQEELIASLQEQALELRRREFPAPITEFLVQINEAAKPLVGLDSYKEIAKIRDERDAAVLHLCKLIDLLLKTNTGETMTYSQEQFEQALANAKQYEDFWFNNSQQLQAVQAQVAELTTALQAATMDKEAAVAKAQEVEANLNKLVEELLNPPTPPAEPTPETPVVEPPPTEPVVEPPVEPVI